MLALQTKSMQQDKTTQGMSVAVNSQLLNLSNATNLILIYSKIDYLSEDILDILAWQFNCTWYDSKATLTEKRKIIKTALLVHKTRGTRFAVEEVVKSYFDDAQVVEWFEYGGDPYTFKVVVKNGIEPELAERFTKSVNAVKNVRSRMDELIVGFTCADDLFCDTDLLII
jgi:phage tail P2-like protein